MIDLDGRTQLHHTFKTALISKIQKYSANSGFVMALTDCDEFRFTAKISAHYLIRISSNSCNRCRTLSVCCIYVLLAAYMPVLPSDWRNCCVLSPVQRLSWRSVFPFLIRFVMIDLICHAGVLCVHRVKSVIIERIFRK